MSDKSALDGGNYRALSGRRIYIHRESMLHLARQNESMAKQVFSALVNVEIGKIVHHHVIDQGAELRLVRDSIATDFYRPLENQWKKEITSLFTNLGFRPSVPRDRSKFYPLLLDGENIVATCSDQGYLTFATDAPSAERMFTDFEPISSLIRSLRLGAGPEDLTVIKGRSLASIASSAGTGLVGKSYAAALGVTEVSIVRAHEIELLERKRSQIEIGLILDKYIERLNSDENLVFQGLKFSIQRSLSRNAIVA